MKKACQVIFMAAACAAAVAACSGRGLTPATPLAPAGTPVAPAAQDAESRLASGAVKQCASGNDQPRWIFEGACDAAQISNKGGTFGLPPYANLRFFGSIGKTTLASPVNVTIVDATGQGDVQPYKKKPFPAYATSGRSAVAFLQLVNQASSFSVTGSPALTLGLTYKQHGLSAACGLAALLTAKKHAPAWSDLPYPVSVKRGTLKVSVASLPFPIPKGALYLAVTCPSASPTPTPSPTPSPTPVPSPSATGFVVHTAGAALGGIALGPDGAMWATEPILNNYAELSDAKIAKIAPTGRVIEYHIPNSAAWSEYPEQIVEGPGGKLWFTAVGGDVQKGDGNYYTPDVASIDTSGHVAQYWVPEGGCHPYPAGITTGPDGNVWFTDGACSSIAKLDVSTGSVSRYPNIGYHPYGITTGPDGNLWFTDNPDWGEDGAIGRLTPGLTVTEWNLPAGCAGTGNIVTGPDGNLWFTVSQLSNAARGAIGRITPSGKIVIFPATLSSYAQYIVRGADGNMWFTESGPYVGKITPSGHVTEYKVPPLASAPNGISPYFVSYGPDGNIWFTDEETGNLVVRFHP